MEHALIIIAVTIAISTVLNIILKKYDIPTVIGYIFSGVIISSLYNLGDSSREFLSHVAEFGIVFLMFTIGLEFSFKHLKGMKHEVFTIGALQVSLTGTIISLLGYFIFGLELKTAIIIGLALSLSSTAIVLKMLNENGQIHSGYGKMTLGILLFQDLAAIPILLMVSFFADAEKSVSAVLMDTLGGAVMIFAVLFIFGKYLAERFFKIVMKSNSEEIFLVSVLFIVITASILAEFAGFTYSLGAFLAGMLLSETKYRYRIEADLIPFRDILLGVFFITIGLMIDTSVVFEYFYYIMAVMFLIMSVKGLTVFLVLSYFSVKRTSIKTAFAVFQIGEFALAVFALAASKGIIDEKTTQILISAVVLSMVLTPFVLKNIKKIADVFTEEDSIDVTDAPVVSGTFHDHTIVCGYGPIGKKVVKKLKEDNALYVILEHDSKIVADVLDDHEEPIFFANAAQQSTLEHFNIKNAKNVIVAIENPIQLRLVCENIASFGEGINSIAKVSNDYEQDLFLELGITSVINKEDIVADLLYSKMQRNLD